MSLKSFSVVQNQIVQTGQYLASKNWAPATSSNYSIRLSNTEIAITRSGIDKSIMTAEDIILINYKGEMLTSDTLSKPSAETLIHTTLYHLKPEIHCVLHTHSVLGTRLSLKFIEQAKLEFTGYELQKGLGNNASHESVDCLPILPNSQDMQQLSENLKVVLKANPKAYGFLIAGHGLYTWAKDIADCKKQIESFEFLMECKAFELMGV